MNRECKKELLHDYIDNQLDKLEKEKVEIHLKECASCADFLKKLKKLKKLVQEAMPTISPAVQIAYSEKHSFWFFKKFILSGAFLIVLVFLGITYFSYLPPHSKTTKQPLHISRLVDIKKKNKSKTIKNETKLKSIGYFKTVARHVNDKKSDTHFKSLPVLTKTLKKKFKTLSVPGEKIAAPEKQITNFKKEYLLSMKVPSDTELKNIDPLFLEFFSKNQDVTISFMREEKEKKLLEKDSNMFLDSQIKRRKPKPVRSKKLEPEGSFPKNEATFYLSVKRIRKIINNLKKFNFKHHFNIDENILNSLPSTTKLKIKVKVKFE